MKEKLEILKKIASKFNQQNIVWNLGGSANLYLRGITNQFNDLDIMVHEKDVHIAKDIMSKIALLKYKKPKPMFGTKHFFNYEINHVEIDIMSGFAIFYQGVMHHFPLKDHTFNDFILLDDVKIFLEDLDTWLTYYQMMDRKDKIDVITQYKKEVMK